MAGHSCFGPVLSLTLLPGGIHLVWTTVHKNLSTSVRSYSIVAGFKRGTGILTCFPFAITIIRLRLGPTYPRLIDIASEPLPFRPLGFPPKFSAYYYQDLCITTVHRSFPTCFYPMRSKTYRIIKFIMPLGIGSQFEPRPFSGPYRSMSNLVRTF